MGMHTSGLIFVVLFLTAREVGKVTFMDHIACASQQRDSLRSPRAGRERDLSG